MSSRKRLGEMLLTRGQLQPDELDKALAFQHERHEKLGRILLELGYLSARDVLAALSDQLEIPIVTASDFPVVAPEVEGIALGFMKQFRCLPLGVEDSTVTLAMADPLDSETIAAVRLFTRKQVRVRICSDQEILAAMERHFVLALGIGSLVRELSGAVAQAAGVARRSGGALRRLADKRTGSA